MTRRDLPALHEITARGTALVVVLASGCVGHIAPYHTKHRELDLGAYGKRPSSESASIFAGSGRGLYEDDRARRVGDIVIIQIEENGAASHEATTKLDSQSKLSVGLSGTVATLLAKAIPAADLSKVLGTDSQFGQDGKGTTSRKGTLSGTLPVRVREVMPNDDLFLEGTKVVMVSNEEHHLYISGIIRQADLRSDGTVSSSRVADAEIEYTGRGDVSDHQRQGWFTRLLHKIWPF